MGRSIAKWSLGSRIFGVLAISALTAALPAHGDTPSTQPAATQPMKALTPEQLERSKNARQFSKDLQQLRIILGDQSILRDASKRTEVLAKVAPIGRDMRELYRHLTTRPSDPTELAIHESMSLMTNQVALIALGDPDFIIRAKTEASSTNSTLSTIGKLKLLTGEWLADADEATQLNTLDKISAILKSADVTNQEVDFAVARVFTENGATDHAEEQWKRVILASFPNPNLAKYAAMLDKRSKDTAMVSAVENKPLLIEGAMSDGKVFSTEQWKGKVILVDFWATWCGPCKAELPHVKQVYQKYHAQGFEVLGVSADYTDDALVKYLAADPAMAWPSLFDDKTEGDHQIHPLLQRFGIQSIPVMFLIDRNGVCRTVDARHNMDSMIPALLAEKALTPAVQVEAPGTQPVTTQPAAAQKTGAQHFSLDMQRWNQIVGDQSALRDPAKRAELLAQLFPLDGEIRELVSHFASRPTDPKDAVIYDAMFGVSVQPTLIALGDANSLAEAKTEAASANSTLSTIGRLKLLTGEWLADPDAAAQLKTLDKIAALLNTADVNNKSLESAVTRVFTVKGATDYATKQWRTVLLTNFPNANLKKYAAELDSFKNEIATLNALENKPLVIEGTTSDGKHFSTDPWKGKVILVDFWATWCGPCKEELPRIKTIYHKYQSQGLEVLGVSTDRTNEILSKYLAADPGLAWPCLFDDKWDGNQESRPLSVKCGIPGLPTMLLIDRNGICRTVQARAKMETMIPSLLAEKASAPANRGQ